MTKESSDKTNKSGSNIGNEWEMAIGLEIHAQITSTTKLFSCATTVFGKQPNSQVSLLDAGFPGTLPVINDFCIEQAVKTGLALNGKVNNISNFDRKNYFYPDLPLGYQISQFYNPIISDGSVTIDINNIKKNISLDHIHIEQDAGKSIHDLHPNKTLIDLNRSGVPLMEIVTKPEMKSSEEAMSFVKKLRSILRYLGTCNGNMEKGNLRIDLNISVNKVGDELGTRVEIKNLNSIRFMNLAIDYEVNRQIKMLDNNDKVQQETRLFDPIKYITKKMRSKEDSQDYRYFPDPDLPPIILSNNYISKVKESIAELPDSKQMRFMKEYSLSKYDSSILVSEKSYSTYFEESLKNNKFLESNQSDVAKITANLLTGTIFSLLKKDNMSIEESKISEKDLSYIVEHVHKSEISNHIAKGIINTVWDTGEDIEYSVHKAKSEQNDDRLEYVVEDVLDKNKQKVEEYNKGKLKLFDFFIGMAMKNTRGKADPVAVRKILTKKLSSEKYR